MKLPEKPYYDIIEVAQRWSKKTGNHIPEYEILKYVDFELLEAFVFFDGCRSPLLPGRLSETCRKKVPSHIKSLNFLHLKWPPLEGNALERYQSYSLSQIFIDADELKRFEQLMDEENQKVDSIEKSIHSQENRIIHNELPKELQVAIDIYYEFWNEKPKDTNPASKKDIAKFISEKIGKTIPPEGALFDRLNTISKPEEARTGGSPKSEWRTYKGKSKENP